MLFLLALKWNLKEKAFSSVKAKTNSNFVVKLAKRSNHSFLLPIKWIAFFKHLYFQYVIMEWLELNCLCKHMKKVRSDQTAILVLNWVKYSFSLWLSLKKTFRHKMTECRIIIRFCITSFFLVQKDKILIKSLILDSKILD